MVQPPNGARRPVALVTGASSGIGRALAIVFARQGHDLVLVARNEARLTALAARLQARFGGQATVLPADLADPAAPRALVEALAARGLTLDVLVNNAGFGQLGPFAAMAPETIDGMLQVNVVALTRLTRLVLPAMVARGRGRILNVASTAAFQPGPLMAVYYASKAYVVFLSEALASELEGTGVTVTALCPGPTRSEFHTRAGIGQTTLGSGWWVMDAMAVARAGYRGLMRGESLVIPGRVNQVLAFAPRFTPRTLATRIVRRLHGDLA